MKVLQSISCAYRATSEEQDDTVLWLTHAMKGAGGDFTVLLSGGAVNYAVATQDASGLSFGAWQQTAPPQLPASVAGLIAKGVDVYALEDDLARLGIAEAVLVTGVRRIERWRIGGLLDAHDQVWNW